MLEFIIALLLSLGINVRDKSSIPNLDNETINIVQSDPKYGALGGNEAFQTLLRNQDSNSKGEDDIVVTVDPNPIEKLDNKN